MLPLHRALSGEGFYSKEEHQEVEVVAAGVEQITCLDVNCSDNSSLCQDSSTSSETEQLHVNATCQELDQQKQDWLFQVTQSGMLAPWLPLYLPPAVVCATWVFIVFCLPLTKWHVDLSITPFTENMAAYLAMYVAFDWLLRFMLSLTSYLVLTWQGFSSEEITMMAGPELVIPVQKFLEQGGGWLYQVNSYGRKIPHVLHWAGLATWVKYATDTPWQAFQFTVMGATTATVVELCCLRCANVHCNVLVWLSVVRTGDGYARRMNKIYTNMSSSIGMGCSVPLCAYMLAQWYGDGLFHVFFEICTLPCAYGDCLAEIVGVWGRLRFKVYGIGEVNNKSVEGMAAMFLGSFLPCLPYADVVGGWPGLCWVALLATIAETWSPRGCDNVFIPVFSGLGVFLALMIHGEGE